MSAMLGDLPTWNLSDLYSSPTGPDLAADLKRAAADADAFAKAYEGKVAAMDGKALGAAVARFEALNDLTGRIGSYASLYYAQDMADPERGSFSQNVSEALTDIGTRLVFFRLEINKLEDADLAALEVFRFLHPVRAHIDGGVAKRARDEGRHRDVGTIALRRLHRVAR